MAESEMQPLLNPIIPAAAKQQETHENKEGKPFYVSIVSQPDPPPKTYYIPDQSDKDKTPLWKKILEFTALGLAIIVAAIYGGQLWIMKGQLKEMHESTKVSIQAAYASCVAAKIAGDTLKEIQSGESASAITTDSLSHQAAVAMRSEGAQVTIDTASMGGPAPFKLPIHFENIGNSTALDVALKVVVDFAKVGEVKKFIYTPGIINVNNVGSLARGRQESPNSVYMKKDGAEIEPSGKQMAAFAKGEGFFIAYGILTYRDIFGMKHWTRFCHHYGNSIKGPVYEQCGDYNRTDTVQIRTTPTPTPAQPTTEIACVKPD
jgi:hypothetical protein